MAKPRKRYVCSNCGTTLVKWEGRCPSCKEWETLIEEVVTKQSGSPTQTYKGSTKSPITLSSIQAKDVPRVSLPHDTELERVLGGGIVAGAVTLIGGQPGIGKSTLMLQLACKSGLKVLYVSGEESIYQIKMRADRIHPGADNCLVLAETEVEIILHHAEVVQPDILLIDSIQTVQSRQIEGHAGSISQIRASTQSLTQYAKDTNTPVFVIGHITKEGSLAGPKLLEHMVDVVLQFEGDRHHIYRILRTIKNRFGSTDEIGIYEMVSKGLLPVSNPSELLISPGSDAVSGSSIASTVEGIRPLLIETQALVSPSVYGHPQRSTTGFDSKRLNMLLAVLEKKCQLFFSQHDVFLNMAGGIKVSDPAIDLSIIASLISSLQDIPIDRKICLTGEVGLSGEVRPVSRLEQRIAESARLGFDQIIIPKHQKQVGSSHKNIMVTEVGLVQEVVEVLFT